MNAVFKLFLVFMMTFSTSVLADQIKTVSFNGQLNDQADLEIATKETRYRTEMQNSTCSRQVAVGSHQECEQVRRYRQECHMTPDRYECYYTQSHQECYNGPSHQECRQEGGGMVCTYENGRRICRNEPGHQVCHTVPGERICHTVPGERVCHTVPGRYECEQVPYYENVCHMETDYRTEYYACQKPVQVPYQVDVFKKAQIDVALDNQSDLTKFDLVFSINAKGEIKIETPAEDLIIFATELSKSLETQGDTVLIKKSLKLTFKNKKAIIAPFKTNIQNIVLTQDELSFVIGKVYDASLLKFDVSLFAHRIILIHKEINYKHSFTGAEVGLSDLGDGTLVKIDLRSLDLPKRKYELDLSAKIDLAGLGSAINLSNGETLSRTESLKIKNH